MVKLPNPVSVVVGNVPTSPSVELGPVLVIPEPASIVKLQAAPRSMLPGFTCVITGVNVGVAVTLGVRVKDRVGSGVRVRVLVGVEDGVRVGVTVRVIVRVRVTVK